MNWINSARIAVLANVFDRRSPLGPQDRGHFGFAQLRRRFDQRVEHRLQVEGRAADDLEHVGGGGLLLQDSQISVRACTSSNNRMFSMAITAWSAKVVTSSICLSVNG